MRKPKLSLNFRIYSDSVLLVKADIVAYGMTNNPNFPDPVPMLPAFKSAVDNYGKALTASKNGGKIEVSTKKANRKILEQMCVQLALYVMYIANGDESILISSAFPLCKQPETAIVGLPMQPVLRNGVNSGEVVCKVKLVNGAYSYQFHVCSEPPTETTTWKIMPSTRCKRTFRILSPAKNIGSKWLP